MVIMRTDIVASDPARYRRVPLSGAIVSSKWLKCFARLVEVNQSTVIRPMGNVGEWQQGIDLAVGARRETFQYADQPACRVKAVEFGGGEQALDGGGAAVGLLRPGEQPVLLADGDRTNGVLDQIVVVRQYARIGIAFQRRPALERVIDGLGRAAAGGDGTLRCQQPGAQLGHRRPCL